MDFNKKYYVLLFILSLIWVFLGQKCYNNFSPFIFFIFGLPVFSYLYFKSLNKFSNLLKDKEPELFDKTAIHYGYFKNEVINIFSLFDKQFFDKLKDNDLINNYKKLRSSFNYLILSFISFVIISVLTVYIR